ncbi:MAG: site-specific integrase [Rikenellaceae bacterium]
MKQIQRTTFNVLFFIKHTRLLKNGEAPIRMRVTINKRNFEVSTKRSIAPASWDQNKERCRDKSQFAKEINHHLDTMRLNVLQMHDKMEAGGVTITVQSFRDYLLGDAAEPKSLVGIFTEHNEQCRKLIGVDFTKSTVDKFGTTLNHVKTVISEKYGREDLLLTELSPAFVREFELYLKTTAKCKNNSALKHLKNLKKVVRIALNNGWLERDPFVGIKFKREAVHPEFLTDEELKRVMRKDFGIDRLNVVRDLFVFNAFTGLAFIDAQKLCKEHLFTDNSGSLWIRKPRQKTGTMCNIPIMRPAQEIMDRYATHPDCADTGYLLPRISNQCMNSYLKEIAAICGINKRLSSHVSRHTFSTSVTLANGVSVENLAKMLGHTDIKMTQHYAKVLDSSVKRDMDMVNEKICSNY